MVWVSFELPREVADQVLREMLLLDGVQDFYVAVRAFGGAHRRADRKV